MTRYLAVGGPFDGKLVDLDRNAIHSKVVMHWRITAEAAARGDMVEHHHYAVVPVVDVIAKRSLVSTAGHLVLVSTDVPEEDRGKAAADGLTAWIKAGRPGEAGRP